MPLPYQKRTSARVAVAHAFQIELELGGILRPAAASIELSALLDGERHVVDVAFHAGGRLQRDGHAADDAGNLATHDHALGGDSAGNLALLADDDFGAGHVALDLAVDLQCALADDLEALADDLQVVADDRLVAGVAAGARAARHVEGGARARA